MSQLYVPDGVFLVCTKGLKKQQLTVTSQSTIEIAGGRLAATENDRMGGNHNCARMVVAGAIIGALVVGVIAAATIATGGAAGAALIGACAAGGAIGGAGAGLLAGLIPCICALLTHDWEIYHPSALLEKQKALLDDSIIPCRLGGDVLIFYSEEAADAAVRLKRITTICDVGIVAVTAFAMSFTGVYKGFVTAGKSLFAGFSQFGFKIGMANAGQMALAGGSSYLGGYLTSNLIIKPVRNAIYDNTGLTDYVTPANTDINYIMGNESDDSYRNPDKPLKEIGKISNTHKGNQTSSYTLTTVQRYEIYNISGQGQESSLGASTGPKPDIKPGATLGNNSTSTTPQYDADIRMSDRTGYAEGGTRTQTTTGTQYKSDWKGSATGGIKSAFKPKSLGKSAAMTLLSDALAAIKNPIVKGYVEDFEKSLEEEEKAKAGITVVQDNEF